jgi:16S rRNA (guanine527-N7)-methyltransferase
LITARAFSSTKNILEISEKNLMKEGRYLLLKGKIDKINEELESINTNKYKCEIIKTENEKYERHLVEIKINE